jgi:hypothetical protein
MSVDVREWLPDLYHYKLTALYIVAQLLFISRWPHRRVTTSVQRPPSDATWFVPVFVWGLESLRHLAWWLTDSHGFCFGVPPAATLERAKLTSVFMIGALAASFLSEHQARRHHRAVRAAQATVPMSVLAALFGVQWTWALSLCILYMPIL